MTTPTELDRSRANLVMVQAAPFNAEAPPDALMKPVTPTDLHYVRSNFALPEHDGNVAHRRCSGQSRDTDTR